MQRQIKNQLRIMESILNHLKNKMVANIEHDLANKNKTEGYYTLFELVLNAYNAYQEEERDGVDYIFNINNIEDVKCCLNGGMTIDELATIYNESKVNTSPYFFFGVNHKVPNVFWNEVEVIGQLVTHLYEIIPCVIAYVVYNDAYKKLYEYCITNYMTENNLVP